MLSCHATAQPKQRLGLTDRPAPSSPPQMAPVHDITSATEPDAPASVSELPSAQPASPSSMYQPMDTEPPHIQLQSGTDFLQPHANATVATAAADDAASQQASTTQAAAGSQSQGADVEASHKDNSTKATSAASFSGDDRPPPLGFDRQIHVFTREAIAAAEASTRYTFLTLDAPHVIAACHMYQLCVFLMVCAQMVQSTTSMQPFAQVQSLFRTLTCPCHAHVLQERYRAAS